MVLQGLINLSRSYRVSTQGNFSNGILARSVCVQNANR